MTSYRLGFDCQQGQNFFLLSTTSKSKLGPIRPLIIPVTGVYFQEAGQLRREALHSTSSSAKDKNEWNYTSDLSVKYLY
jgi:hypothetical protein